MSTLKILKDQLLVYIKIVRLNILLYFFKCH